MLNMLPNFSSDNKTDENFGNSKLIANIFVRDKSRLIKISYEFNLFIIEFAVFIFNTAGRSLPSLFAHVLDIILLGTKKNMVGPYAQRIIAFMKSKQSFWYRTILNLIRNSMGQSISRTLTRSRHSYSSVSFRIETTDPNPTCFGFSYFIPKALLYGYGFSWINPYWHRNGLAQWL